MKSGTVHSEILGHRFTAFRNGAATAEGQDSFVAPASRIIADFVGFQVAEHKMAAMVPLWRTSWRQAQSWVRWSSVEGHASLASADLGNGMGLRAGQRHALNAVEWPVSPQSRRNLAVVGRLATVPPFSLA